MKDAEHKGNPLKATETRPMQDEQRQSSEVDKDKGKASGSMPSHGARGNDERHVTSHENEE